MKKPDSQVLLRQQQYLKEVFDRFDEAQIKAWPNQLRQLIIPNAFNEKNRL